MLDKFYITILNHYKKNLGKHSLKIALMYINLLELSITMALGAFFLAFAKQMKMQIMTTTKFWILITLIALFIIFKNWMRYNGKKRVILNAKSVRINTSIVLLWLIPIAGYLITFILLQV
ncbi:hypothetical protein HNV08_01835 [Winogradskyella eckloniae]|uniref:hypothetical protein n=1 Tax=Winogradskyella eckloniae TaxID=1089306 RepID=UPI001565F289|nr:hypothetical protein [Winogradskyella eckloniae]NRD18773.1 hypothetical protein [Winogradskyella eckloniae]